MFCENCGAVLKEGAKFCTSCGASIEPIENQGYGYQSQQAFQSQGYLPQDYQPQDYQPQQALDPQEKKGSGKTALFVLLGILFLLILIIGTLTLWYILSAPDRAMKKQLDLGQKYLEELDYDMAIETYMDAIDIDPQKADGYLGLSGVYEELEDYESAVAVLEDGLENVKGKKETDAIEERLSDVEHTLKKASRTQICGTVIIADADMDYSNDKPLSEAKVTLERELQYEGTGKEERTNGDGYFTLEDVTPGEYMLKIKKSGFATIERTIEITGDDEILDLSTMEAVSEEWVGEGTASGMIYDVVSGAGISDLTLKIENEDGDEAVGQIRTDADGSYVTPKLEAGRYKIEILDERGLSQKETYSGAEFMVRVLGNTDIPNQDGTVSLPMEEGQIRIVLTWGETPEDLDSHLWCDGPQAYYHIYYEAQSYYMENEMLANLDLDDTTSYGPETTTVNVDRNSTYHFGVFNYTGADPEQLMYSGATVQVYTESAGVPSQTFQVPAGSGYYWDVFTYDGATGTITPVNTITENYGNYFSNADYDEQYGDGNYAIEAPLEGLFPWL